jgi:hypothetical protein
MKKFFSKPSSPPKQAIHPQSPQPMAHPNQSEIETQFAVLKMKDGRVVVQFPVLDQENKIADIPLAIELCGAGLQALGQLSRQQKQEKSLITVVPAMPNLKSEGG